MLANFLIGLREGLETALFLWAATQAATSSGASSTRPLLGALLGILTAIAMGYAFYKGVLKINLTKFFTGTGTILIVVAAGVLAYGFHDLQEAGILPGLNSRSFDVSSTIKPDSWLGTFLKGIFNFSPATTWLEASVWVLYVVPTLTIFLRRVRTKAPAAATEHVSATPR